MRGNMSLMQALKIAVKHDMKGCVPATMIIGKSSYMNSKDRLIYSDPKTNKVVVKKTAITIFDAR